MHVTVVRGRFERLLAGRPLPLSPAEANLLFSRAGLDAVAAAEKEAGAHAVWTRAARKVSMYGTPQQVRDFHARVVEWLGSGCRSERFTGLSVRQLVHLSALLSEEADLEVQVDMRSQTLFVEGSEEGIARAEALRRRFLEAQASEQRPAAAAEECCFVCFCELDSPYTLAACGHRACTACLSALLKHDLGDPAKPLPVVCCGEGGKCGRPVGVEDMQALCPPEVQDAMFKKGIRKLVANKAAHQCPTPDCEQLYRDSSVAPDGLWMCDVCGTARCVPCMEVLENDRDWVPHPGRSCEDRGKILHAGNHKSENPSENAAENSLDNFRVNIYCKSDNPLDNTADK